MCSFCIHKIGELVHYILLCKAAGKNPKWQYLLSFKSIYTTICVKHTISIALFTAETVTKVFGEGSYYRNYRIGLLCKQRTHLKAQYSGYDGRTQIPNDNKECHTGAHQQPYDTASRKVRSNPSYHYTVPVRHRC